MSCPTQEPPGRGVSTGGWGPEHRFLHREPSAWHLTSVPGRAAVREGGQRETLIGRLSPLPTPWADGEPAAGQGMCFMARPEATGKPVAGPPTAPPEASSTRTVTAMPVAGWAPGKRHEKEPGCPQEVGEGP